MKGGRVGGQQGGDTGYRQPQQHLVTHDNATGRGQACLDTALAGGGDQVEIARAGDGQKNEEGDDERAVVGDAKHGEFLLGIAKAVL
ncbi:hypothetical protein D3C78_1871480 [compost metagenome]